MIEGSFDVIGAAGARAYFGRLSPTALSHGYLLSGPPGSGKKTFAVRLAQSLLCVTPKAGLLGYCARCGACAQVAAATHPDLYVAHGQLKIGDRDGGTGFHEHEEATARDLVRQLSLHSYAGGRRVFILGDADFTREAANALLKFFEEPPADVVLIVTTSQPGRILATIRSRLIEVMFAPLGAAEIEAVLVRGGASEIDARRAAAIANGNVGRAKAFVDGSDGSLREAAASWFFAAVAGEEADHATWAARPTLEEGLETIKTLTRDWLVLHVSGPRAPLLAPDRTADLLALPRREPAALTRALSAIGDAERVARTNVPPALVAGLVRMALAPGAAARGGARS